MARLSKVLNEFSSRITGIKAILMDREALESGNLIKFIETLQIHTEREGRQSLLFRPAQEDVWHRILGNWEAKKKAWFLCLKSRREGVSTLITAICFARAYMKAGHRAYLVAHDWTGSDYLFGLIKTYWTYLDKDLKAVKPVASDTKRRLRWAAPHDSMFSVGTANNRNLGSSEMIHDLHLSEVAKYEDPHDMLTSILQCVPDYWDTLNFWESTARGKNHFYQKWTQAEKGLIDYEPIFLSWRDYPFYSLPPLDEPTSEEREKAEQFGLDLGQLAWLVDKKRNKCQNDWGETLQEYPPTPDAAFKASGWPWFPADEMAAMETHLQTPVAIGRFEWISELDPVVEFQADPNGRVTVWEWPEPDALYVMGMDVSEGVGAAFTVVQVLRLGDKPEDPVRQAAKFRSNRVSPEQAAVDMFQLGCFYNRAFAGVERNNHGHATLGVLKAGYGPVRQTDGGYPSLFFHKVPATKHNEETSRLGWQTDKSTRPVLFARLKEAVLGREMIIRSKETFNEMEGIQWDLENEQWIQEYLHPDRNLPLDDEVFSLGIALQMCKHWREHRFLPRARDGGY